MALTMATHFGFIGVPCQNYRKKIEMADFTTWTQESLAKFAQDANDKMIEQNEHLEQLQRDVKDAIEAYRGLMRLNESQRGQ